MALSAVRMLPRNTGWASLGNSVIMVCHDQRLAFGCGLGSLICLALAAFVGNLAGCPGKERQFCSSLDDSNGAVLCISGSPGIAGASPYVDFAGHLTRTWRWHRPPFGLSSVLLNSRRSCPQSHWIRSDPLHRIGELRRDGSVVVRTRDRRSTVHGICYNSPSDQIFDSLGLCGMGQD